jgi:hypothetical protein
MAGSRDVPYLVDDGWQDAVYDQRARHMRTRKRLRGSHAMLTAVSFTGSDGERVVVDIVSDGSDEPEQDQFIPPVRNDPPQEV